MHSTHPPSPNERPKAATSNSARRSLGLAFAVFLMSSAGVTSAPTAAPGADDGIQSGNATVPVVPQAVNFGEPAQLRAPPGEKARNTRQQSGAGKALGSTLFAANAATPNPPNHAAQTVHAASALEGKESAAPPAVVSMGFRSPGPLHKISVSDRQLVQTIQSQGGRLIADYGSFFLMEADAAVISSLTNGQDAQIVDENNLVLLNAGAIDTSTPAAQALRATPGAAGGKQMRLIQFAGPIRPEWYEALVATGVRIVTYIPSNSYLVYGTAQTLQAVQRLASNTSIVQWDAAYVAAYRVDPAITRLPNTKNGVAQEQNKTSPLANLSAGGNEQFTIQLVEDMEENPTTLALIDQFKLETIVKEDSMLGYYNVRVALPRDLVIGQLAERGDVVSIQQWIVPQKRDERQSIIMTGNVTGTPAVPLPTDYQAYLAGKGFSTTTTAAFAVNVTDSGVDNATTTPKHFALYRAGDSTLAANSRVIFNRLLGTPNVGSTLQGCDGHGNLNAHIIGGYVPTGTVGGINFAVAPHADASGLRWGLGLAPFVKVGSSVIFDPNSFTSPIYQNLESQAFRDSARISSNSWGADNNSYTVDSQQYDALVRDAQPDTGCTGPNCISTAGNQEYVIVFAAGNAGSGGANTVGEPGTAKNVITVGAAENVNPFGGADGSGIADTGADNANDMISFSSRGPTADGRSKPDIVAPGTHVSGGAAQAAIVSPPGSGTGATNACFTGAGVSGGVFPSLFFPAGQQWYTASSGTSHSTPAVAGAAALIRQHFINQVLPPPSPAMTKALLLNSARYLNGVGANDTLPSNNQGMGEVSLNNYFDVFATAHSLHDQVPAETFTASGQQRVFTGTVSNIAKPFRVTLAWTDAPGPTTGSAFVNNLDLEVTIGGNTYKGNVFSGAFSATGGIADTRNNVESVYLPAGVSGNFIIKVKAANIAGNGVPNNAQPLDQDFALVAYNVTEAPFPAMAGGLATITAENFVPPNNAPDPGETLTALFPLFNVGLANTTSLVATLLNTGGVTPVTTSRNYGVVVAGGSAGSLPFTFVTNGACGDTITATFHLQDGALDLGNVSFQFRLGTVSSMTFSNAAAITIPASGTGATTGAPATPYPSNITVVGAPATISKFTATISNFSHTFPDDVDLLLVSPTGRKMIIMSDAGFSQDAVNLNITLDDSAASALPDGAGMASGTFRPANYDIAQDPFPAPAPPGPYLTPQPGGTATLTSAFTGAAGGNPNGTWSLYVVDDAGTDVGNINGGWALTTSLNVCSSSPLAFSVTYDGNGHTGGMVPVDGDSPHIVGSSVTVLGNINALLKAGFIFAGWNSAANGSGTAYAPGDTFTMPAAAVTLFAQWTGTDANLSNLTISAGSLAPAFAGGTLAYTDAVTNATTSVTVTPTAADATAAITVNGGTVISGNVSGAIALAVGSGNVINVVVTAQDGTTTRTYTITVTRAASTIVDLAIAMTHSGNFSRGAAGATFTITVSNVGGVATNGSLVSVIDTLPVGLTATALSGSGWACVLGTLTCTRSEMLGGGLGYPAITLTVSVAGNAPGGLINSATVSGGGDANAANNTVTDGTSTVPGAPAVRYLLLD